MICFHWDDANMGHLARHGVIPDEAEEALVNDPLDLGGEYRNGEERKTYLGRTVAGRILVVVIVQDDEFIRVVTAWPAKSKLRRFWQTQKKGTSDGTETQ